MFGIHFGPDIKLVVLLQFFNQPVREDGKNLIGGGLRKKGEPGALEGLPQQSRHVVCMLGQLEIQIILKQLAELQAQDSPLGQQCAFLLHMKPKFRFERFGADDQSLAQQSTVFGAADIKGIGQSSQVGQTQAAFFDGKG